jgi:CBS domain-containing protein
MRNMIDLVRDQSPLTLPPTATVMEAAEQMRKRGVGAALVTDDDGVLLGIFTGRDAIARVLADGRDPIATPLTEVMTHNPRTLTPRNTTTEALRLMQDIRCRHIPIVQEAKLLGVVSRGDFRGLELDRLDEETALWERIG